MTNEEAIIKCKDYLSRYEKLRKREDFTKNDEENVEFASFIKSALESIDRITAERDALLNDLKIAGDCHSCLHNKRENLDGICCRCFLGESRWEWRGVQL